MQNPIHTIAVIHSDNLPPHNAKATEDWHNGAFCAGKRDCQNWTPAQFAEFIATAKATAKAFGNESGVALAFESEIVTFAELSEIETFRDLLNAEKIATLQRDLKAARNYLWRYLGDLNYQLGAGGAEYVNSCSNGTPEFATAEDCESYMADLQREGLGIAEDE